MSRRSSRRAPKKSAAQLPAGVQTGLASLVESNEDLIAKMLSVDISGDDQSLQSQRSQLVTSLADCMTMNDLSAEALLARFFDASVLSQYAVKRLGVSGKGNEATLAARIVRAWSKKDFEALPLDEDGEGVDGDDEKEKKTKESPKKRSADDGSEKQEPEEAKKKQKIDKIPKKSKVGSS